MVILSAITNADKEDNLVFYILDNKISTQSKNDIEGLKTIKTFNIHWLPINAEDFAACRCDPKKISVTTCARFLIPQLIEADKVLYLDCDLFVHCSLCPLFSMDISNYYMAGVTDYGIKRSYLEIVFKGTIHPIYYLNAGVLLINNKLWREHTIADELFSYAGEHSAHLRFADQDCLNYLLSKKVKTINPAWNVMDLAYDPKHHRKAYGQEPLKAAQNPYIRHSKP